MNAKHLMQKVVGVGALVAVALAAVVGPVAAASITANSTVAATSTLSADEAAGLIFMREEEKLAHDVYVTLYQQYGLAIFNNVANSEATHMASIKTLLDRYGLIDPATGNGVGVFENADLQALYTRLIAQGSQSLSAALKVGAAIEEIDILDLKARLATTTHSDIQQVYTRLMNGSYNHLRSFVNTLKTQTGEVYQPQHLDTATYQSSLSGVTGQPGGGGTLGGGNRGGGPLNQAFSRGRSGRVSDADRPARNSR